MRCAGVLTVPSSVKHVIYLRSEILGSRCALSTLGSPWSPWKRSYVHVPVGPRPVAGCMHELGSWGRGVPGWCRLGGYWRVVYRVPTHPPTSTRILVLPGPNQPGTAVSAPTGHSRPAAQAFRTPGSPHSDMARFRPQYLKVSQ